MVKLLRFFLYLSFFMASLIYFTPKISTYYFLENFIKRYDVVLSNEELVDSGLGLKIKHPTLSLKSIDTAKANEIDIKVYGVYNSIDVENVYLSSVASSFIPLKIEKITALYSIIDPINVRARAYGEFGEINAHFDLVKMVFRAELTPSKLMLSKYKKTLRNFKKSKEGGYVYEKNI